MTGCYNVRVGIHGALSHTANHGLGAGELTLAELVKQKAMPRRASASGTWVTKQQGRGVREPGRLTPGDLRFDWKPGQPNAAAAR